MRRLICAFFLALASVAGADDRSLKFEDAWVRLPPPNARTAAGYVVIKNGGATAIEIEGAQSEAFGSIMLHETTTDDQGVSRMRHLHSIRIEPGESFRFEPNGPHLMMFDPVARLNEGADLTLVLELADGELVEVVFPVLRRAPGD